MACLVKQTRVLTCNQRSTPPKDRQLAARAISRCVDGTFSSITESYLQARSGVPQFAPCLAATATTAAAAAAQQVLSLMLCWIGLMRPAWSHVQ